jgi:hypothetical protein
MQNIFYWNKRRQNTFFFGFANISYSQNFVACFVFSFSCLNVWVHIRCMSNGWPWLWKPESAFQDSKEKWLIQTFKSNLYSNNSTSKCYKKINEQQIFKKISKFTLVAEESTKENFPIRKSFKIIVRILIRFWQMIVWPFKGFYEILIGLQFTNCI